MKQPHIYTLPERFIEDPEVPLRWKLYTIINGFWIAGKPVFASNAFFAEKLGCSERHVRECLLDLEKMFLISRHGLSQNRRILPCGARGGAQKSGEGGAQGSERAELEGPHISDSISDSLTSEVPLRVEREQPESRKLKGDTRKYPNARIVFSWFPKQQPFWNTHSTELKHAEMLFTDPTRGEVEVKKRLRYLREHAGEEFLPQIDGPYDLNTKWEKLSAYAKRNS